MRREKRKFAAVEKRVAVRNRLQALQRDRNSCGKSGFGGNFTRTPQQTTRGTDTSIGCAPALSLAVGKTPARAPPQALIAARFGASS